MAESAFTPARFEDTLPRRETSYSPSHLGSDALRYLPKVAAGRLRALTQNTADLHAVIPRFAELSEAHAAKQLAEQRIKQLTAHPQDNGFGLPDSDSRVQDATANLAKAAEDLQRLSDRQATRTAAWTACSQLLAAVNAWLGSGIPGNVVLEGLELEAPQLGKRETLLEALEKARRRCRELQADLARIAAAPLPSSHCKKRLREFLDILVVRGEPIVSDMIEHDDDPIWPSTRVQAQVYNTPGAVAFNESPDVIAILTWLLREQLEKKMEALIGDEADDQNALSPEERSTRAAVVQADLIDVERREAAILFAAWEQGLPVTPRADLAPAAILNVRLITRPGMAARETSPELAVDFAYPHA